MVDGAKAIRPVGALVPVLVDVFGVHRGARLMNLGYGWHDA